MLGALLVKKLCTGGIEALTRGDLKRLMRDWTDDAVFVFPPVVSVGGEIKGRSAIEAWFAHMIEYFPKREFTIKNSFVENVFALGATNTVAVEWDIVLENKNGREFRNSGVTTMVIKGGKAVRVKDYIHDNDTLKRAWGEAD